MDRQSIFNYAMGRILDPETKRRFLEADHKSLPPDGKIYDCWMAAMYIMGKINSLSGVSEAVHLRKAYSSLPELAAPGFLSLVVQYVNENPVHVGLVIDERANQSFIWNKPGTSIARINTVSELIGDSSSHVRYFDSGLR